MPPRRASTNGFKRTANLLTGRIRDASAKRGFGESRLLTQWAEIAGPEIAAISRPVAVSYGRGGLGATLTLLTKGAHAPMLEMQKQQLRDRVNSVYGHQAIKHIRITQTAATGFAEGQVDFDMAQTVKDDSPPEPTPVAKGLAAPVADDDLRLALERLGTHILNKTLHS
ncbi:MAG: DUF721 domain-containing protein [Pseudomonadota bacterium]